MSQARRWRHPSVEFAKLLARTLLQPADMLTSIVFLETSIPNTPSITVLSFHFISSARAPLRTTLYAGSTLTRVPSRPSSLDSGAWKTGPELPHGLIRQRDDRGSPFSSLLSKMCLFAENSATYKGRSLPSAPRTEPYVRLSRIRLPPRVCDGKAVLHFPYAFQRL